MWPEAGTITFSTPDGFDSTLRSLRSAIGSRPLTIQSELDVAERVATTLNIRLAPCRILYVSPDPPLKEELSANAWLVLPLHVVIAMRGSRTDLCVLGVLPRSTGVLADHERDIVARTQRDIVRSLEAISVRTSFT